MTLLRCVFFSFTNPAPTEIYTLSLHDALPISAAFHVSYVRAKAESLGFAPGSGLANVRSEEHTSELQSPMYLVCRLLLEKKKNTTVDLFTFYVTPLHVSIIH